MEAAAILQLTTQVIEGSVKTSSAIYNFIKSVRESRADLDATNSDLMSLQATLKLLKGDLQADTTSALVSQIGEQIRNLLSSCMVTIEEMQSRMKKFENMRRRDFSQQLQWATTEKPAMKKLSGRIGVYKTTLGLTVDALGVTLVRDIKNDTTAIIDEVGVASRHLEVIASETMDTAENTRKILEAIDSLAQKVSPGSDRHCERNYILERYLESLATFTETSSNLGIEIMSEIECNSSSEEVNENPKDQSFGNPKESLEVTVARSEELERPNSPSPGKSQETHCQSDSQEPVSTRETAINTIKSNSQVNLESQSNTPDEYPLEFESSKISPRDWLDGGAEEIVRRSLKPASHETLRYPTREEPRGAEEQPPPQKVAQDDDVQPILKSLSIQYDGGSSASIPFKFMKWAQRRRETVKKATAAGNSQEPLLPIDTKFLIKGETRFSTFAILEAALTGDLDWTRHLVERGADLSVIAKGTPPNPKSKTVLSSCFLFHSLHWDVFEELVRAGAPPHIECSIFGQKKMLHIVHYFLWKGKVSEEHLKIFDLFEKSENDPRHGPLLSFYALNNKWDDKIAEKLSQNRRGGGTDYLRLKAENGPLLEFYPLQIAVYAQNYKAARFLLAAGASQSLRSNIRFYSRAAFGLGVDRMVDAISAVELLDHVFRASDPRKKKWKHLFKNQCPRSASGSK